MPSILYIAIIIILLNVITGIYINKKNDYQEKKEIFDKEQLILNNKNIEQNILSYYNNIYGDIHQNYVPSTLINEFSNKTGDLNKYYLFNANKLCVYTDPNMTIDGEETELAREPKKILTTLQEIQKNQFNKNIDCETMNLDDFILNLPTENINEQEIIKNLGKIVGSEYFLRIDVESVKNFKTIRVPILNIYLYKATKRQKPDLSTEIRLNTDVIVNDKINEAKLLLDNIANMLNEYGKRRFKGFTKLKSYTNYNAFSNLAEGYMIEQKNGSTYYGVVSINSGTGFQTGDLMAFHTRYFNSNTKGEIDKVINDKWRDNTKNKIECDYVNSSFVKDSNLKWYSDNTYYICKIITTNILVDDEENIKPKGYCSLEDICSLEYTFDKNGKINKINSSTLQDFLLNEMQFDMSKFKNPFYPNQLIEEKNNFIVSSSNNNKGLDVGISLNIGLKIVNRPIEYDNGINFFSDIDLENNYLLNKYFISY